MSSEYEKRGIHACFTRRFTIKCVIPFISIFGLFSTYVTVSLLGTHTKLIQPEEYDTKFEAKFYVEHPLRSNKDAKLIMLWTNNYSEDESDLSSISKLTETMSPKAKCVFSTDRRFVRDATAVVLTGEHFDIHDVPIERASEQIYVWYNLQPPGVYDLKGKRSLKSLMAEGNTGSLGFFNWTATYSQSSNIVVAPRVAALASHVSTTKKFLLKGLKKKLVAWYPPECATDSGREKVRKKLAGLQVDVYGRCGTEVCPAHGCWQYLSMRYIFYLSFENNLCIDYISDQVWEPLKAGLIPVVYGGANYTRTLPRNSFIDAREYSAANLTSLLIKLSSNSSELGKYHEWRSFFNIENEDFFGQLCSKVHEIRRRPFWSVAVQPAQNLTNNPLHKWWLNVNKCWTDYPRKRVNSYAANVGSVLKFIKKLQMIY